MPSLSIAELVAGFLFGSIGFVAFVYGKREALWRPMFTGLALMIYPYFVAQTLPLFAIGTVLTVSLLFAR